MDSSGFRLEFTLVAAIVVLLSGLACQAQPPATNGWQPIVFSAPDNAVISSNLDSLSSQPSSSLQTKLQLLQDSSPVASFDSSLPAPVPTPMPFFQKPSDNNQQWEFMTPAEILGVTPDQILQTRRGDSSTNQDLSLSPMERQWWEGQNSFGQSPTNSANNSFQQHNFWANGDNQTNSPSPGLFGGAFGNWQSNSSTPFLGNAMNDNSFNQDGDTGWPKMFGSQASQPVSSPAQQQQPELSQFMQLLNPNSQPGTAAAAAPDEATSFKSQFAPSISDSSTPSFNPIGASFTPITRGISRPAGLTPLPSISQPASVQTVAPPAWAPQQPPWMSSAPQPFVVPQRKF